MLGRPGHRRKSLGAAGTLVGLALAFGVVRADTPAVWPSTGEAVAPAATPSVREALRAACQAGKSYVATAVLAHGLNVSQLKNVAIVASGPSSAGTAAISLARQSQVGATWGLAHDGKRALLYAAAYQKRGSGYGPGGPGAVYRIDLATGRVEGFATLEAGSGGHDETGLLDRTGAQNVGRMGLGDIDLDEDGSSLFVSNLLDDRIYRLQTTDGSVLASFANGAATAPWAAGAKVFGLAVHGGRVYHGVVDTQGRSTASGAPVAYVFSSRPDGSDLREELALDLGYPRGPFGWRTWTCPPHDSATNNCNEPMLADLDFSTDGRLILGLRDRQGDTGFAVGHGDLIAAQPVPGGWSVQVDPEFFDDRRTHDESFWGGFAISSSTGQVAAAALSPERFTSGGLIWSSLRTGGVEGAATLYGAGSPWFGKSQGLGDVEQLCSPTEPTSPTPSSSPSPAATRTDTPTVTARPTDLPTPVGTRRCPVPRVPCPVYLPVLEGLPEACPGWRIDVALVVDISTSMQRPSSAGRPKLSAAIAAVAQFLDVLARDAGNQGAIVGFNATVWQAHGLSDDWPALRRSLDGLAARMAEGTRLDLALAGGMAALNEPARRRANMPVMVLLTDGLPNRVPTPPPAGSPEDTVRIMVRAAQARGIRIYVIGLGRADAPDLNDRINVELLQEIAGRPEQLFLAPDAEELEAIFQGLARSIPCAIR